MAGQSCGIDRPGRIYLAACPERYDYLKQERAKARYMGLDTDFISLEHARELNVVVATDDVDWVADEPIFHDGQCVGYVTSGGYGHAVRRSLALGYVPARLAADGTPLQVEILGRFYDAAVTAHALYDPDGARMRG